HLQLLTIAPMAAPAPTPAANAATVNDGQREEKKEKQYQPPKKPRQQQQEQQDGRAPNGICKFFYNRGTCTRKGCQWKHPGEYAGLGGVSKEPQQTLTQI